MTNREAISILVNLIKPPIIRNDGKSQAHLLALEAIQKAVVALEADPVKHGRWIKGEKVYPESPNDSDYHWSCSECRCDDIHNINAEVPFCWHCGAKMDEVEE